MKTTEQTAREYAEVNQKTRLSNGITKSDFIAGIEFAQRWIPIPEELPPEDGQEILLKNEKWINEDYNTKGVRVGSYCDEIWTSAYWCGHHDEYHTRTSDEDDDQFTDSLAINQIPTHWRPIERI